MSAFRRLFVCLLICIAVYKPAVSHPGSCEDHTDQCRFWANTGRCQWDNTLKLNCPVSCNSCIDPTCYDRDRRCTFWSQQGYCVRNPTTYLSLCPHSCDSCLIIVSQRTQQFFPWLFRN
ncbi:putative tyrosinase-like protein tyr-3 [Penaeus indicus]|uniref:putative tyrosinase-like protein tyr-3 n=1 Tax=Penaeus indicus TaxID=29960 RepID=UPI00300CFC8B